MPSNRASAAARRGIVDPRLLRYARATRSFLATSIGLGLFNAVLIIAQAWLLADVIAGAFTAPDLTRLALPLEVLLGVVLARATVAWIAELVANRLAAQAKQQLRSALLRHITKLGPGGLGQERTGTLATLATRGIDTLDAYFSLYLPQVLLAVIVPGSVLVVILARDWVSAAIIAFTLPLVPLFMALVGATTRERTELQLDALHRLASHFLDAVSGLTTLRVFGQATAQVGVIRAVSERQRHATLATLRITFLSSLVLELVATLSVALVAVAVGLRLLAGDLDLRTGLLVLILAPETYLPLRALGANFHASAEGVSAAQHVFSVLEAPVAPAAGGAAVPDPAVSEIWVDELTVQYPDRERPALEAISFRAAAGEVVAVTGPSGSGKSTLLGVLLGFIAPTGGAIRIGPTDLRDLDPASWREEIVWLPQRPHLFAASIAENLRLGRLGGGDDELWQALEAAGLAQVVAQRPDQLETRLGDGGWGLSAGERQRLALARAFLRDAPLLLLDEPTANLDHATECELLPAIRRLMQGRTVILAAHRPSLSGLADQVVELDRAAVAA